MQEERRQFEAATRVDPDRSRGQRAQAYARMARVYHAYDYLEAALACYRNLDQIQPGIFPALYAIGRIHHSQGRYSEALEPLRQALEIAGSLQDTSPAVLVAMLCVQGDTYLKLGRLQEAEAAFQRAVDLDPRCAYAWAGLGTVRSVEGNAPEAIRNLERAVSLQPNATAGRVMLAREYRRVGQAEKAALILPEMRQQQSTPFAFHDPIIAQEVAPLNRSPAAIHRRAVRAREQGNATLALELFEQTLVLDPDFTQARANLAGLLLGVGRAAEAEGHARQVIEQAPGNASFLDLLGAALLQQRRFDEALEVLQKARGVEPDQASHIYWMGATLSWQAKLEDALGLFNQALKLEPGHADACIASGVVLGRLGRFPEAAARLRGCLDRAPRSVSARLHLARALSAGVEANPSGVGEALELALPVFREVKGLDAAATVAMAYAVKGDFEEAVALQQEAVTFAESRSLEPEVRWLRRNLDRYRQRQPVGEAWNPETGYPPLRAP